MAICFGIPICLCLPYFYCFEIVGKESELFAIEFTEFGMSKSLNFYLIIVYLIETVFPVFTLAILNIISIVKFRQRMKKKGHLLKNQTLTKKRQLNFTVMVLILTTICFVTRVIDLINGKLFMKKLALFCGLKFSFIKLKFF